jgi:hypothetical protein
MPRKRATYTVACPLSPFETFNLFNPHCPAGKSDPAEWEIGSIRAIWIGAESNILPKVTLFGFSERRKSQGDCMMPVNQKEQLL